MRIDKAVRTLSVCEADVGGVAEIVVGPGNYGRVEAGTSRSDTPPDAQTGCTQSEFRLAAMLQTNRGVVWQGRPCISVLHLTANCYTLTACGSTSGLAPPTHGITPDEVRAVVTFPTLRLTLAPRRPNSAPMLYVGPAAPNEPWIEVIADMAIPEVAEVFHAMMLRRSTFSAARRFAPDLKPTFTRQRR